MSNRPLRLSDYRLSPPMKEMMEGLVNGYISRGSHGFQASTAEALFKRGLLDANYAPTETGLSIGRVLIAMIPRKYSSSRMDGLIEGLQIIKKNCPLASPCGYNGKIAVQAQELGEISSEDSETLNTLGWERTGKYLWEYRR